MEKNSREFVIPQAVKDIIAKSAANIVVNQLLIAEHVEIDPDQLKLLVDKITSRMDATVDYEKIRLDNETAVISEVIKVKKDFYDEVRLDNEAALLASVRKVRDDLIRQFSDLKNNLPKDRPPEKYELTDQDRSDIVDQTLLGLDLSEETKEMLAQSFVSKSFFIDKIATLTRFVNENKGKAGRGGGISGQDMINAINRVLGTDWQSGGGATPTWGSINGLLSDQTDLQDALDLKADDSDVVHLADAEIITGEKTITAALKIDGGLKDTFVSTAVAVGESGEISLDTIKKSFIGAINEVNAKSTSITWGDSRNSLTGVGLTHNIGANAAVGVQSFKTVLDDTQANALVAHEISLGSSAIGHIGLKITASGASSSQKGLHLDCGAGLGAGAVIEGTGDFVGLQINGNTTSPDHRGIKYFSSQLTSRATAFEVDVTAGGQDNHTAFDANVATIELTVGRTSNLFNLISDQEVASAVSPSDNFDLANFLRTAGNAGTGGSTLTKAGSVVRMENASSGVSVTDSVKVLEIIQSVLSTGAPIDITQNAITNVNFRKLWKETNAGVTLWISDGTTPDGNLSGIAGDVCYNGPGGAIFYCTGTVNWNTIAWGDTRSTAGTGAGLTHISTNQGIGTAGSVGYKHTGTGTNNAMGGAGFWNNADEDHTNLHQPLNMRVNAKATTQPRTLDANVFISSRTHTGAVTDDYDVISAARYSTKNGGGASTVGGAVAKFQNIITLTSGALNDSSIVLELIQDANSSGLPLDITQNAVVDTNFQLIANFSGSKIFRSDGTTPDGNLTGAQGDVCFNGPGGQLFNCTGGTNWTGV